MKQNCLICNKSLAAIFNDDPTSLNCGVSCYIDAGYGSKFDSCQLYAVICDDCLEAAKTKVYIREKVCHEELRLTKWK